LFAKDEGFFGDPFHGPGCPDRNTENQLPLESALEQKKEDEGLGIVFGIEMHSLRAGRLEKL
jgi:hypothetical protein